MNKNKTVVISNEVLALLKKGRRVDGRLMLKEISKGKIQIVFMPYNRKYPNHKNDRLIKRLEHGWVKESPTRIKVHDSIPKDLGTARIMGILDREIKDAKNALIDREIVERV